MQKRNADNTQIKILNAATKQFIKYGFEGARVDNIATAAKVNKQLIYYYFKSKDNLFSEVLKKAYRNLRENDEQIDFDNLSAYESILKLTEQTWNFYQKSPDLIFLLLSENMMRAHHLKKNKFEFQEINKNWLGRMELILKKGKKDKTIRDDLDPMQLNISIAALIIFYITNCATLSVLYETDLSDEEQLDKRLDSIKDTVGAWISPKTQSAFI